MLSYVHVIFVFKQKTAYEMRISDWSSDVCSSDLLLGGGADVDEQRGVVGDFRRQHAGDARLLLLVQHLAGLVGEVLDARRQPGAAVVAAQEAEVAAFVDVAPDGLRRHVEVVGERLEIGGASCGDRVGRYG